ncbi:hypothetical protein NEHOM01_0126 [Nematocida homosporus]|uniref:uncharacterized protein n=1 Tax=Nematocida homosporus TaxID=1912981 RepID=UPI00221EE4B5|nr:uncharacterized protein NEHOM01_0126 [Nematocida homosporus]KAI5184381.1 hypothetical protein NEHOM01_0126 [Nematocida homosporus]
MLGMSKEPGGLVGSEFTRYLLGRTCASVGLVLGCASGRALAQMHSARIFLTLDEIRERGVRVDSGSEVAECLVRGLKLVSSGVMVASGSSLLFRGCESLYLLGELGLSAQVFYRIYRAYQRRMNLQEGKAGGSVGGELAKMYTRAGAILVCDAVEAASFILEIWPLYLVVGLVRGGSCLWYYHGNVLEWCKEVYRWCFK